MFNRVLFSSKSVEHYTPRDLYDSLHKQYNFTTDPCTTAWNHLGCQIFFYKREDCLRNLIDTDGLNNFCNWKGNIFINPPYGRGVEEWIEFGFYYAFLKPDNYVVMLLPYRPDTKWYHRWICSCEGSPKKDGSTCTGTNNITTVRRLSGRLKFGDSKDAAPFPSAIVIFKLPINEVTENK